jgi:hypothetical protein
MLIRSSSSHFARSLNTKKIIHLIENKRKRISSISVTDFLEMPKALAGDKMSMPPPIKELYSQTQKLCGLISLSSRVIWQRSRSF